jgi:peptidoglycan/LPS O-acetylase OafA/YrhL
VQQTLCKCNLYNVQEYQTVRFAVLHRGEMLVDNFFVISGMLVAYIYLQVIPRIGFNLLLSIVVRISR